MRCILRATADANLMLDALPDPLPNETLERLFTAWRKPIDRGENLLVLSAPYRDRAYRIPEFIDWLGLGYTANLVSLVGDKIEDINDWKDVVGQSEKRNTKKQVCIIVDAEHLLTDRRHLLQGLSQWHLATRIPLLLFSEQYPYEPMPPVLSQNRYFHRLYSAADMRIFLSYLEAKFEIKIADGTKKRIIDSCGGHLWLAKEIVRYLSTNEKGDPFDHDALTWRAEQMYQGFVLREQEVLQALALKQSTDDKEAYGFLEMTSVISGGCITIRLLEEYIKQLTLKNVSLRVVQGRIKVGSICIEDFLSPQEQKAIRLLLTPSGVTVPRELLGKAIWGEEWDFTDWALDQAMKRLRKKLLKFGIPVSYIQTVKGKGYHVAG